MRILRSEQARVLRHLSKPWAALDLSGSAEPDLAYRVLAMARQRRWYKPAPISMTPSNSTPPLSMGGITNAVLSVVCSFRSPIFTTSLVCCVVKMGIAKPSAPSSTKAVPLSNKSPYLERPTKIPKNDAAVSGIASRPPSRSGVPGTGSCRAG